MKQFLWVAAVVFLAACGGESEPESEPATEVEITGEAHYMERIMMPPDSVLEIALVDEVSGDRLVVERMEDVGAPPYPFDLRIDQDLMSSDNQYLLQLTLYLPDATPRFSAEVPVSSNQTNVSEVRLIGVDSSAQGMGSETLAVEWHSFQCGDVAVDANFEMDDQVTLSLPWGKAELPLVPAASGARYDDGEIEFWTRGTDQAHLTIADDDSVECSLRDSMSPWTQAMLDGVDFRAVGNEPGWHVEVMEEEGTMLLTLDHGANRHVFEDVEVWADQAGYHAESSDHEVTVTLAPEPCQDSMVGWTFPFTVSLDINGQALQACGRFLH
ncbi:MliC family protein [Vreelandella zhaodongensis]|nr:MliC family protein [Halomonas zhaodongensis]